VTRKLLLITPEERGGIRTYSDALWPELKKAWNASEGELHVYSGRLGRRGLQPGFEPDLIHIQHEFGLFGPKLPLVNRFPSWVAQLREWFPGARVIATAHTVLGGDYTYPLDGRGWQIPFRAVANRVLLPRLRQYWIQGTWGLLDGVIVHSGLQRETIEISGCKHVAVIPHYVPESPLAQGSGAPGRNALVFGYFSPEKGQDLVIRAYAQVRDQLSGAGKTVPQLVLAGGVRRPADQKYFEHCQRLIGEFGLKDCVTITGYVPDSDIDRHYAEAALVVAPFRETSGSGSLAHAFARGSAILASDLPLNREMLERVPGCLELFKSEDPQSCAAKMLELLGNSKKISELKSGARKYADQNSIAETVARHLAFYEKILI